MLTIENISTGLAGQFFTIKGVPYMVNRLVANKETYLIQLTAMATTQMASEIEVFLDRRAVGVTEIGIQRYKLERIERAWKFSPITISIGALRNKKQFMGILEKYLNKC